MAAVTTEVDIDDDKKQGIVDYLQAPKKKRRNFIIMATGKKFDTDIQSNLEMFIRQNFRNYAFSFPKKEKELSRLFSRQIVLLIIDDNFIGLDETIELINGLKQRKTDYKAPILFLTKSPEEFIQKYHDKLLAYQEGDNYVDYRNMPSNQLFAFVRAAAQQQGGRKSRRFIVDVAVKYFHLAKDQIFSGKLKNMSLHGAIIQNQTQEVFRLHDQLQIHFPVTQFIPEHKADFIKVSGKVRRVFMGGDKAGISWEYLSEEQYVLLTKILMSMVNRQINRFHTSRKIRAINMEKK